MNSRSLCPKIHSFIDTFKEMEACLAICTETWLKDGQELEDDIDDLLHGSGIGNEDGWPTFGIHRFMLPDGGP